MKGEFDSPSKPASETYRENWERVFGRKMISCDWGITWNPSSPDIQKGLDRYPNGCPILDDHQTTL